MGVDVRLGGSPSRVTRDGDEVTVELSDGSAVTAAEVLVATGRTPRTEDLGLEAVGLEAGAYLDVDDTMLVTGDVNAETPWLYAVGDVNHRALLTHQGKYQARAAGEVIAARATGGTVDDAPWGVRRRDGRPPRRPAGHGHRPGGRERRPHREGGGGGRDPHARRRLRPGSVAGSSLHADGDAGKARMVVDEDRGVIVGVTFVGQDVAELLHSATIAVVGEVPVTRLWHAVPSYPTISEVWLRLLETYWRPTA